MRAVPDTLDPAGGVGERVVGGRKVSSGRSGASGA